MGPLLRALGWNPTEAEVSLGLHLLDRDIGNITGQWNDSRGRCGPQREDGLDGVHHDDAQPGGEHRHNGRDENGVQVKRLTKPSCCPRSQSLTIKLRKRLLVATANTGGSPPVPHPLLKPGRMSYPLVLPCYQQANNMLN